MKTSTSVGGVWSQTSIGSAGAATTSDHRALGIQRDDLAGGRIRAEQLCRFRAADVESAAEQAEAHAFGVLAAACENALNPAGSRAPFRPSAPRSLLPPLPKATISTLCAAFQQRQFEAVAAVQREHRRAAALHHIALDAGVQRRHSRRNQPGRRRRGDCGFKHDLNSPAGSF